MNSYKASEQILKQQSSTRANETQLLDARRQRKETDDQLQAMMNRISFLAQEELRLDRDIEAARRRAAEALARQATRDQDIAATAREVLAVMPASTAPKSVRPHTGRSSLIASLSDGASSVSASTPSQPPSLRTPTTPQHSSRNLENAPSVSLTPPTPSAAFGSAGLATPSGPGLGAGSSIGVGASPGTGQPPRAPSASRSRPPVLAGRASDKVNKLPPVAPTHGTPLIRSSSPGARPGSASRPSTASRSRASSISPNGSTSSRRMSADVPIAPAASAVLPAAATHPLPSALPASPTPPVSATHSRTALKVTTTMPSSATCTGDLGVSAAQATHVAGMQHRLGSQQQHSSELEDLSSGLGAGGSLSSLNAMAVIHGGELAFELPMAYSGGGSGSGSMPGRNIMTVIHGGAAQTAGELDGEVIEELQHGSRSTAAALGGPSGLQEFATESGRKVVVVKASRKTEGTTVSAAGVGWGMGSRGASTAAPIAAKEARQLQAEMAKKQQIWKVRKTFGLEPTPLSDRSAQVEELGAGAWQ